MAFQWFKFRSKTMLGVDIGTAAIKVTEVGKEGGRWVLKNYGIIAIPDPVSLKDGFADDAISAALKELIKKSNFSSKDCVASIPSFNTFSTVIELPYLSEKDIARAIPFEAKKYIPLPLQEVNLDWSILSVKDSTSSNVQYPSVEVFIAAVPKDTVERYRIIFNRVGLRLKALELENAALIRALIGNDQSSIGVVNMGGRSTSIFVAYKGVVRLSRNYEVGGFEITQALARSLKVSVDRAESMKKKIGIEGNEGGTVLKAINTELDRLIVEGERTIETFEDQKKIKVEKIILTGGLGTMPGIHKYFESKLHYPVSVGDPFARVIAPQGLSPVIKELTPTLSVSIGLAMREI
ncbi:MAG: type IV pilus assembly protein PilM [Parcubacteria group bacterium]|nr:type IV pilus assembly protein PilM [Parcubacteria group bacterium]